MVLSYYFLHQINAETKIPHFKPHLKKEGCTVTGKVLDWESRDYLLIA